MLKFSKANAKTSNLTKVKVLQKYLKNSRKVYSLDLLSGWSCPFANECLSKVYLDPRRLIDGPNTKFRCFSASQEIAYPNVYNSRKHNFDLIKSCKNYTEIIQLLAESMPKDLGICRWHVAGDFFRPDYLYAAVSFASLHPDRLFYAYTKSLPYWIQFKSIIDKVPNFVLTASYGGRTDDLIAKHGLRSVKVIFHPSEANGLEIDHDDSHAANPLKRNKDFALLIHGQNPKGSEASKAVQRLRKEKIQHSYNRKG